MKKSTIRLLLLLVTIIWGSGYVVNDVLLESLSAFQLLTARFGLTFIMLLFVFHAKIKTINKVTFKKGLILGALLYAAFAFQTVGLIYTTPSKNAFLTQISVVFVPLLSYLFFKEKAELKTQLGIILSLVGVGFMSLNGFGGINLGDVLSLVCALFFALQVILMGEYIKGEEAVSLMIVQMGTAGLLGGVISLMQGNLYLGGNIGVDLRLLFLALFGTLFSYGVQTASQRHVGASEISLILSLESFWGMAFSMVILKEIVSGREMLGAWLILAGVMFSQLPSSIKLFKPKRLSDHVSEEADIENSL